MARDRRGEDRRDLIRPIAIVAVMIAAWYALVSAFKLTGFHEIAFFALLGLVAGLAKSVAFRKILPAAFLLAYVFAVFVDPLFAGGINSFLGIANTVADFGDSILVNLWPVLAFLGFFFLIRLLVRRKFLGNYL